MKAQIAKRLEKLEEAKAPTCLCFIHYGEPDRTVETVEYYGETRPGHHKWLVHPDHEQAFNDAVSERFDFADSRGITPLNIVLTVDEPKRPIKITRGE
ncbi:hypothetical protein ST37_08300 [Vibrio sp. qd031]|uniref:hypothetical protein n=1 Tax=Vibrio sp. qd031 TaxID=1603038 RepID=UPI000A0F43FA|nr:hypothetical protein [Vibrio sp. qd031]ORT50710.1 hypothetical protein ST37_08300 [Vibrio sp. qd031]